MNNICFKFNHLVGHFNHDMVDLLPHIETTQIGKSNLLNLTVHLTVLVISTILVQLPIHIITTIWWLFQLKLLQFKATHGG